MGDVDPGFFRSMESAAPPGFNPLATPLASPGATLTLTLTKPIALTLTLSRTRALSRTLTRCDAAAAAAAAGAEHVSCGWCGRAGANQHQRGAAGASKPEGSVELEPGQLLNGRIERRGAWVTHWVCIHRGS